MLMKKEKKMTKKASVKVWKIASQFQSNLSKNTSYDEAWEVIASNAELEGDIVSNKYGQVKFTLFRGEEVIDTYDFPGAFKDGDFDWNTIYKTVVENVVARRLYKVKKLGKRAQKKKDEEVAKLAKQRKELELQEEQMMLEQQQPKPEQSKEELKRLKFNLKMKIKHWTNKGKNTFELMKELQEIESKLKTFKQLDEKSSQKHDFPAISKEISTKVKKSSSKDKKLVKSNKNK